MEVEDGRGRSTKRWNSIMMEEEKERKGEMDSLKVEVEGDGKMGDTQPQGDGREEMNNIKMGRGE
jgi:hypothetical protein